VSSFDEFFPRLAPPVADWDIEDLERAILARLSGTTFRESGPNTPDIHIHLRDANGETIGTANGTASAVVSKDGDVLFGGCTLGELVLDGLLVPVRVSLVDTAEKDRGFEGERMEQAAGFPFDQSSMPPDPGRRDGGPDASCVSVGDDNLRFTPAIVAGHVSPSFPGELVPVIEVAQHLCTRGPLGPLLTAPGELTIGFGDLNECDDAGQVGGEHVSLPPSESVPH
jgi:hypothetical protein